MAAGKIRVGSRVVLGYDANNNAIIGIIIDIWGPPQFNGNHEGWYYKIVVPALQCVVMRRWSEFTLQGGITGQLPGSTDVQSG